MGETSAKIIKSSPENRIYLLAWLSITSNPEALTLACLKNSAKTWLPHTSCSILHVCTLAIESKHTNVSNVKYEFMLATSSISSSVAVASVKLAKDFSSSSLNLHTLLSISLSTVNNCFGVPALVILTCMNLFSIGPINSTIPSS